MRDETLKPCPFCGGEGEVRIGYHAKTDALVGCNGCHAEGPLFGAEDWSGNSNKADAIAAWNRREGRGDGG